MKNKLVVIIFFWYFLALSPSNNITSSARIFVQVGPFAIEKDCLEVSGWAKSSLAYEHSHANAKTSPCWSTTKKETVNTKKK